jgi:hypothetical protein
VAEARVLLHRSVLAPRALTPHAAIERVVLEASALACLEALFSEQGRKAARGAGDEMYLALFTGLHDTQARVPVAAGDEPVAGKQVA